MTVTLDPAVFRSMLNADVEVLGVTYTPDGQGGATVTEAVLRTVRGRLRPVSPSERMSAGRLEVDFSHVLYVEAGDEPTPGQTVRLKDRPAHLYRVVENVEPSYAEHHVGVRLMREHHPGEEASS
ncbi:MAG: head-tail adaptor protein [Dehalococcoidia bacterium]|nr:head-tail adaptor protein [Dehalococcoidia bacterium]